MNTATGSLSYGTATADRAIAMVFTRDPDCEGVLRQALIDLPRSAVVFRSEGVKGAGAEISERGSPRLLVVDVSGEGDPIARVRELTTMCEPATQLIVIGDENDIRLYRGLLDAGASDYFFKPLVSAVVARTVRNLLHGQDAPVGAARVGRIIYVVGVRGGCGATSVMVTLGSILSRSPPRPVLLLDFDLQYGDAALALDATPNAALREALTNAERVDDLLLERGLIQVTNHLHLLASLEPLDAPPMLQEDAVMALLDRVTRRYRYVVAEVPPYAAGALARAMHIPSTLVLVSDARLTSARETARWRAWMGENTSERPVVHVLNQLGGPGGLPLAEFTKAAGQAPDIVIPYTKEIADQVLLGLAGATQGPLAKAVEPLAALLGAETAQHKRPLLKRFFG